jgi:hypothetical protein
MYRLRSDNPNSDLFLMAENEHQMAHFVMDYAMKNGIGRMFGWKEDVLKGVDLGDFPEGTYIITEYEPGQVVEANNFGSCTICNPPTVHEDIPNLAERLYQTAELNKLNAS